MPPFRRWIADRIAEISNHYGDGCQQWWCNGPEMQQAVERLEHHEMVIALAYLLRLAWEATQMWEAKQRDDR